MTDDPTIPADEPAQDAAPAATIPPTQKTSPADPDAPLVLGTPANFRLITGICSRCHQSGTVADLYASHDSGFADGYSVDDLRLCRGCTTAAGLLFNLTEADKLLREHRKAVEDRDKLAGENQALRRTLNKITDALKQHA